MELVELEHGGLRRRAWLHRPAAHQGPLPLVVMLHGAGGTGELAARNTGWNALGDRDGFVVLLPEGTAREPASPPQFRLNPQAWNDGSGRGHAASRQIDDVGFLAALMDETARRTPLLSRAVLLAGFSNGAGLAFRAGAELAERVTAVGAVAGHCWIERPMPARPVSLMYLMGACDPLNPISGGEVVTPWGRSEYHPPARRSLDRWLAGAGCTRPSRERRESLIAWQDFVCSGGAVARYGEIADSGHVWPGGVRLLPERIIGRATHALDATVTLWQFFRERLDRPSV